MGRKVNSELKDRIRKERMLSLAFATPFLVFILPGIYFAFRFIPEPRALAFVILEVLFVASYVAVWLLNDPAPVNQQITKTYVVSMGILWGLVTITLLFYDFNTVFNLVYLVPAITFLTPRRHLQPLLIGYYVYAAAMISAIYFIKGPEHANVFIASIVITVTTVIVALSRFQLDADRAKDIEQVRAKNLSVEEERNRMASDLHDVLGQTLTAINTMSQLSAKLLERGQVDQARQTQQQIAELSREGLQQMRAVVRSRQTLTISEEVDRAYQLLTAANINVSTAVEPTDFPEHVEDAVAHVIREGAANVVHHAMANHCQITVSSHGVSIVDDGRRRNNFGGRRSGSASESRQGSGIANLKKRTEDIGTLTAGELPGGKGWKMEFVLNPHLLVRN